MLVPTLVVLAVELGFRAEQLSTFDWFAPGAGSVASSLAGAHALSWLVSLVLGAVLWSAVLIVSASRGALARTAASAVFVALFTIALGAQCAFRARWAVYLSRDATELSTSPAWSALGSLRPVVPNLAWFAAMATLSVACVVLARRHLRPSARSVRIASALAAASVVAALFMPVSYRGAQATTPDLLWFNAVSFAARGPESERVDMSSPQLRAPRALPPLEARPSKPRNVLLVLQESQRADVTCISPDATCDLATPFTNAAAPNRLGLENLRSNGSATTIAMSVLFTGLAPTAPATDLHRAPNLFEIATAAGWDVAYFTSHHLMFANMWLLVESLPRDRVTLGTHLDPRADMWRGAEDAALTERVTQSLSDLREPFFLVVHYSNIHAPRHAGHGEEPFQPASDEKTDRAQYFNGYKNAVRQSDQAVGALVQRLRENPVGERTVVLYTADHGEANGEHTQGCDHGCTLFEEEVRVPGWVDAPRGTLSDEEHQALTNAREEYVFHTDLAPTLLDLMGLWDEAGLSETRAAMIGRPLTRPHDAEPRLVPLSNVSHVWERGLPSYGLMSGRFKLIGRHREPGYRCFDVEADPLEQQPLDAGCEALRTAADELYGVPPSDFTKLASVSRR